MALKIPGISAEGMHILRSSVLRARAAYEATPKFPFNPHALYRHSAPRGHSDIEELPCDGSEPFADKKAFYQLLERLIGDAKERILSDPASVQAVAEEITDILLEQQGETAARYIGLHNPDPDVLREYYVEVLVKRLQPPEASTYLETGEIRKDAFLKSTQIIPSLKDKFFPRQDEVVVFRMLFSPSLDQTYTLLDDGKKRVVMGSTIAKNFNHRAYYSAYLMINSSTPEEVPPPSNPESLATLTKVLDEEQPEHLTEFYFFECIQEILSRHLERLAPETRKPLNHMLARASSERTFFHTAHKLFPQMPLPELADKDRFSALTEFGVFGYPINFLPTYLSTSEDVSLSHCAQQGTEPQHVYEVMIDAEKLFELRNVFVDPDLTDPLEIGLNYLVGGGIPFGAIKMVRELKRLDVIIQGDDLSL